MNWISRIIGETTTAGAIPMAGPGSGAGGQAVKRFKKPLKQRPMSTIERILGERILGEADRPSDPVSPTPERKSPEPDPTPKAAPAPPEPKDEEPKPQPIIPPSAQKLNADGSEVGADPANLTRADRAVLDLFMPKPKAESAAEPASPAAPGVSEADAFRMLGLQPNGLPVGPSGPVSIPSGPMPEHAPSPDGAEKLLEAMRRFTR